MSKSASQTFVIRRHPAGIILIYIEAIVAALAIVAFFLLLAPGILGKHSASDIAWLSSILVVVGVSIFFVLLVATYIYNQNRIIVTDHDIEQIIQRGLMVRKISRLELSDVEDVSFDQKGLLPTLFDYGTLTVETAGAEDNFVFPYCINPDRNCHSILQARGRFIQMSMNSNQPQPELNASQHERV